MAYSLLYSYNSSSKSYLVTGYSGITTSDKVVIPDKYNNGTDGEHSVTSIGSFAFADCSNLSSITIGNSVTSIGSHAFYNCSSLTSITIPSSVTSIEVGAFRDCSGLTSIAIPSSVTSIGEDAFSGCTKLKQLILLPSTPPTLSSGAIPTTIQSIYVQQSSKAAYKAATNWSAFASKIVSDNIYLSFVRFNQKNKEYINGKVRELGSTLGKPSLTYHKIGFIHNSLYCNLGIISTRGASYTTIDEIYTDFSNRKIVNVYYPDVATQTPTTNASISFTGEYDILRIIWIDANALAIKHLDVPFGNITSFSDEVTLL